MTPGMGWRKVVLFSTMRMSAWAMRALILETRHSTTAPIAGTSASCFIKRTERVFWPVDARVTCFQPTTEA